MYKQVCTATVVIVLCFIMCWYFLATGRFQTLKLVNTIDKYFAARGPYVN